jgi:hypothetical protein
MTAEVRTRALDGMALLPPRKLLVSPIDARFELHPGDLALVAAGEAVVAGAPLAERLRDARTTVLPKTVPNAVAGERWADERSRRSRDGESARRGELLFQSGNRWRIAAGDQAETLEAPFGGIVREVRPGMYLEVRSPAHGLLGSEVLGGATSGRVLVAATGDGEVRAPQVDVGAAGAIVVAGARIDAEALTRARAVGVRGVIVASLGVKERRDFLASERRGRAGVHGLPPFGILILDGAARRSIASPVMAILQALEGRKVALVEEPPCLVIDDGDLQIPRPAADLVRVRSGPLAGAEGRWLGLAGPRRFAAGVSLESGFVAFGDRPPLAVPIGDLERFV